MKILYGIQQTGNGHITRSIEMIRVLKARGYDVDIIVSGCNSQISVPFPIKKSFKGLTLQYTKKGDISWIKTCLKSNIPKLITDALYDIEGYDLVITDFEPISAWAAKYYKIPCVGLGNQYAIQEDLQVKSDKDKISEFFLKNFAPCDLPIGIHYQELSNMVQPIISQDILNKKSKDDKFYLIYLPNIKNEILINVLSKVKDHKFVVYTKSVNEDLVLKHITLKKIEKESFSQDLLNCTGIITAAGFSTTSEALVLKKKLWSIPIKHHYEQLSNAAALIKLGVYTEDFNKDNLKKWLSLKNTVVYNWTNPVDKIIEKIISFYESQKN